MQDLGLVGIRDMGNYDPSATYQMGHFVYYEGSTYKVLRNNITGITPSNDGINYGFLARGFLSADAGDITITDTYGEVVAAGGKTLVQRLVDHIISFFVKKEDLSSSGTVNTQNEFAADAWQLNPNNTGSYASGVASQIGDLSNSLEAITYVGYGNPVTLTSYVDDFYTFPCNGIIRAQANYRPNSYAMILLFDKNGNELSIGITAASTSNGSSGNQVTTMLVFKGYKCKFKRPSDDQYSFAQFIPLVN